MGQKSAPMLRGMGIPGELYGRPLPVAENALVGYVYDQIIMRPMTSLPVYPLRTISRSFLISFHGSTPKKTENSIPESTCEVWG